MTESSVPPKRRGRSPAFTAIFWSAVIALALVITYLRVTVGRVFLYSQAPPDLLSDFAISLIMSFIFTGIVSLTFFPRQPKAPEDADDEPASS